MLARLEHAVIIDSTFRSRIAMPEQKKHQPKPEPLAKDTREQARIALQISMDRRG